MMLNKKSQLGKIFSSPYVLILVTLILFVYILIIVFVSVFNKTLPAPATASVALQENNLLLQHLTLQIDGERKEFLMLDTIPLERKGKIGRAVIEDSIKSILTEEKNCAILIIGSEIENKAIFAYEKTGEQFRVIPSTGLYENKGEVHSLNIIVDDKIVETKYYWGKCIK